MVRGVIALFPQRRTVSLSEYGALQGAPVGGMLAVSSNHHSSPQEPLYGSSYAYQSLVDNHPAALGGTTVSVARVKPSRGGIVPGKCLHNFDTWKPISTSCSPPLARLIGYDPTCQALYRLLLHSYVVSHLFMFTTKVKVPLPGRLSL
jgi:hypothetical protein